MRKIPCRLVALDLDGTLLDSNHAVTDRTRVTLQKLSQEGVVVVLASGRMHQSILPISNRIGLENPIISYNGGMVKDAKTGNLYHHSPIPAEIAMELVEHCDRRGLHLNFCLDDELYIRTRNSWSELYESRTGVGAQALGDLRELAGSEPTKMQVLEAPEKIQELLIEFRRHFGGRLYITQTQIEYIEFMNQGVSKGPALRALVDRLGIEMDSVVAFGDSYNDESMMKAVGFSVAMGNAVEEIKICADYVTYTNDEDGVARAIERLLLVGSTALQGVDGDISRKSH